jgi:hypothetical protein
MEMDSRWDWERVEKIKECECEDTRHGEMLARGDRLNIGVRNGSNRGEEKPVYGRCSFRDAGKTGRGEETREPSCDAAHILY